MSTLLEARGVSLVREGQALLDGVDLELEAGQLQALLGPNGAGKSSLVRLLSGESQPSQGVIELRGTALNRLDARAQARRRAVLPQHDTLSFGFTSREVVALGRLASIQGSPREETQILDEVMAATDTTHLAARRYPLLSGGERRRVHLARILAQVWTVEHAVLLLDEPTAGLDPEHQHQLMTLLRQLAARGMGILMSVHDLNLAALYADRCTLLRNGRVLDRGPTSDVLTAQNLRALYGAALGFTAHPTGDRQQWLVGLVG